MALTKQVVTTFAVLALLTSVALAETTPERDFYVGGNLVGPAHEAMNDRTRSDVSVETGFSLGGTPLFGHAEIGTGLVAANAGLELRQCSRGTFFVCGSGGIDAAYFGTAADSVAPMARVAFELGTALRVRMGADAPMSMENRPANTTVVQGAQFKVGLAYVF